MRIQRIMHYLTEQQWYSSSSRSLEAAFLRRPHYRSVAMKGTPAQGKETKLREF